jgi:hypothetical protein
MVERFRIEEFDEFSWNQAMGKHARALCFGEDIDPSELIDFALLCVEIATGLPVAYMTCRKISKNELYLKHGGAFPSINGKEMSPSRFAYLAYRRMLDYCHAQGYARLSTLVKNINKNYLKWALTAGFIPIGLKVFNHGVYLELFREV